jgi:hypothetical protein
VVVSVNIENNQLRSHEARKFLEKTKFSRFSRSDAARHDTFGHLRFPDFWAKWLTSIASTKYAKGFFLRQRDSDKYRF